MGMERLGLGNVSLGEKGFHRLNLRPFFNMLMPRLFWFLLENKITFKTLPRDLKYFQMQFSVLLF